MGSHLLAAVVCLLLCGGLGWGVPRLIARIPEPDPEPEPESPVEGQPDEADTSTGLFSSELPPAPPKVPYVELARARGLAPLAALGSAVAGGAIGAVLGLTGALVYLVPLVPIGVALLVVDWHTTLLPTKVIRPTYVLLAVLVPVAALIDRDLDSLYRAGWGWLVLGGWFWGFWFLTRGGGWGFGDVRLSRVLGPALGYLGWAQLLMGLVLILLVGALAAVVFAVAHRSLRQRLPYGPWMLVGAELAVLVGAPLARGLGY